MANRERHDLYRVRPIGVVRSSLMERKDCPHQAYDGAPEAWVEMDPAFAEGLSGIAPGNEVILLTWFHAASRDVLRVHPRGRTEDPSRGVFLTRSPDRPNPIGLHRVEVVAVEGPARFRVRSLEVLDGTPVIDIKSILAKSADA
jgi:tRNA-Thr(GGU) m(6)t(6)A37 methyltransferase TsaA